MVLLEAGLPDGSRREPGSKAKRKEKKKERNYNTILAPTNSIRSKL